MKKLLSIILAMTIFIIPVEILADTDTSAGIEKALIAVKNKINIPAELTEFSNYVSERNEKVFYNFDWSDEEYSHSISVSCDSQGRITNYFFRWFYQWSDCYS